EGVVSVAALMQFDVAMVDLVMPSVCGDQLAKRLREVSPVTRLVLACCGPVEIAIELLSTGVVDHFLPLPFNSKEELLASLSV
ncbi:MAG: hypothetical protein WA855_06975, partial [Candidatus Acidiferrales bacterium]